MHPEVDAGVALWLVDNVPARMVWHGKRWRVIDTPTRLPGDPDWRPPLVRDSDQPLIGWRFAAKPDDAEPSHVFDVFSSESGWKIRDVWD